MDNVEVVERGKITVNIYEGQKGETGKSLRFEDLTPEQKAELKGEKGDKGEVGPVSSLDNIYNQLKYKGYKAQSNSIEDVIQLLVDHMNFSDLISDSALTYGVPHNGDTSVLITVNTVPNATLVEDGTENTVTITKTINNIPFNWVLSKPIDENDRMVNLVWDGQIRKTFTIQGVKAPSVLPLLSHVEYQSYPNGKYATAIKDDGKTLYFKPVGTPADAIDIVDLVNTAKDENNLPTNIETLVLVIGQPISLENTHRYQTTTSNTLQWATAGNTHIISVSYGSYVIDLRRLKVDYTNVIVVMDQQLLTERNNDINTVYVISNKQQTVSGGVITNTNDMVLNDTVSVSNISVTKLTRSSVELLGINLNEDHL